MSECRFVSQNSKMGFQKNYNPKLFHAVCYEMDKLLKQNTLRNKTNTKFVLTFLNRFGCKHLE